MINPKISGQVTQVLRLLGALDWFGCYLHRSLKGGLEYLDESLGICLGTQGVSEFVGTLYLSGFLDERSQSEVFH